MDSSEIFAQLRQFFPESNYTAETFEQCVESGELNIREEFFANTLKGALLDESLVEVQLHGLSQIYFCRILDKPYDAAVEDDGEGEENADALEYEKGFYLDEHDYAIITPLEPSMGNYLIGSFHDTNNRVLLRIVSSSQAIELGCFFDGRSQIGDMPALKLTFPFVARKTKGTREFRAKVPKDMGFQVRIERAKKKPIATTPLNISFSGMSLLDPMGRHSNLKVGENLLCVLQIPKEKDVLVDASVIHLTRLRDSKGTQYCFGVRFLFSKPTIKSFIEKIVGLVQRKYLQELSNYEEMFGVFYDKD
ncbi:MAG: PilZ domain-containing protein [Proteobacteria bacterium]|nr:PilZ domain-containing protein [Pseudomonadota bacterium]